MANALIQLTDVTLRDGLQSETHILPLEKKLELFQSLLKCSFSRLEITSFSHPKWIPQLADSDQFCEAVFKTPSSVPTEFMAFVPNEKGLERFLKYPIQWASFFTATSERFHQKNVNVTIDEGLKQLEKLIEKVRCEKRKVRVYVSTVFGCPFEGEISIKTIEQILKKVISLGPDEITLSDTIGVASPVRLRAILEKVLLHYPTEKIALHLHNTYGLALSNIQESLHMGILKYDGAMGGVGGCPYAKGASGNVPTEEIGYLFRRNGYQDQIDWKQAGETLRLLDQLKLSGDSHLASILKKGGSWYGI